MKNAYIHIPFCNSICTYCDFCKFIKNSEWVNSYLDSLSKEIKLAYKNETLDTLYIGGGTPSSLSINELKKLFDILKLFKLSDNYEFTFECNIENINEELLKLLRDNRVNRISIGVETFNNKFLAFLNRHHTKESAIETIKLVKKYFDNINVDLIYALKDQTIKDIEYDIDILLDLDITHISTYSLIIEENTMLYINNVKNIDEDLDYDMYKLIENKLSSNGYIHYEVSNYAKTGYESKHNLTYWNNNQYYGFGCGASGYIDNVRYDNTRSITDYIKGKYLLDSHILDTNETLENEFILGFRKLYGINKENFKEKYNMDIHDIDVVNRLLSEKKLIENEKSIYINPNYIYTSNNILTLFLN